MESGDSFSAPPLRLVSFVSQEELDRAKSTRGERVEDGTAQRDRPLFEILRENKEKKDAEFNERFKHRPPKALDEDETEFLDNLEMSRKEYEQRQALEEAEQLRSFQEAVAARASIVHELKEAAPITGPEEHKPTVKKSQKAHPLSSFIVSVKPQSKKAKTESSPNCTVAKSTNDHEEPQAKKTEAEPSPKCTVAKSTNGPEEHICNDRQPGSLGGLVSYSDDSEDDS